MFFLFIFFFHTLMYFFQTTFSLIPEVKIKGLSKEALFSDSLVELQQLQLFRRSPILIRHQLETESLIFL